MGAAVTLDEILRDLSILDTYKPSQHIPLECSTCRYPITRTKRQIVDSIESRRLGCYCTRKCIGLHQQQQHTVGLLGVPGRVCQQCAQWVPLEKFPARGRSKICSSCRRQQPMQRFTLLRSQAKFRGWSWQITYEEFMTYWKVPCYYCGGSIPGLIGLDRIESSQGYTQQNVVACCGDCNRGKGDQPQDVFITRCINIARKNNCTTER